MTKKILTSMALAALSLWASAETVDNYSEGFDGGVACPKGWRLNDSSSYSPGKVTTDATGHSGSCLKMEQYGQTQYSNNYYYNCVLTTPKMLTTTATIWVKPVDTTKDATFTVYTLDDNNSVPSYSSLVKATTTAFDAKNANWQQITISDFASGKYLGIRGHNVCVDDFAAPKVDYVLRKNLILNASNKTPQVKNAYVLYPDENGKADMKFEVKLTNDGDVDFNGDFTATFKDQDGNLYGQKTITGPLKAGEVKVVTLDLNGPVTPSKDWLTYYRLTLTHPELDTPMEYSSSFSFHIYPYQPIFCLMAQEGDDSQIRHNASDWNKPNLIDAPYIIPEGRDLWLYNSAKAPMEVTAVTCSDGFALEQAVPFTISGGQKMKLTLKSNNTDTGVHYGTITFKEKTLGDVTYNLVAMNAPTGKYTYTFEDETISQAWVNKGNYWKLNAKTDALNIGGSKQFVECSQSTSYPGLLITPQIKFADKELLTFLAAKYFNGGEIKVMYSTDRETWTELTTIACKYDFNPENWKNECNVVNTEWRPFAFEMPEGAYYIGFQAGYGRLDNIVGGTLVDKKHDVLHQAHAIPVKGNVNARFLANYQGTNLMTTDETDYRMVLEFDGTVVADGVMEVEDTDTDTDTPSTVWKSGETAKFNFTYIPHTDGTFNVTISLLSGDDREVLASGTAVIDIERDIMDLQIGDPKIFTVAPIDFAKKISQSEILYTPEMLKMDPQTRITAMTFETACNATLKKHVKIYATNTDKTGYPTGFWDEKKGEEWENLTLLYDHVITIDPHGDEAKKEGALAMKFDFDTPIVYDGRTLLIQICMNDVEGSVEGARPYMSVDNSPYINTTNGGNMFIYRTCDTMMSDNIEDWWDPTTEQGDLVATQSWYRYSTGYPVTYFSTAKDVVNLTGTVTDELELPVEGADIKLQSANYLYSAVTDNTGYYKINVMQLKEPYTLTVEAEGYDTIKEEEVTFSSEELTMEKNLTLYYTDKSVAVSGDVTILPAEGTEGEPVNAAGATVTFAAEGFDTITATTDANGHYELTAPMFGVEYTVTVTCPEAEDYTSTVTLDGKTAVVDIALTAKEDGINTITATEAGNAVYYNLQGIRVATPQPGNIYIRCQNGTSRRVLVK